MSNPARPVSESGAPLQMEKLGSMIGEWDVQFETCGNPDESLIEYFADGTKEQLLRLIAPDYNHSFIIVAISHPEHPLLVIDLFDEVHREFRAVPSQIQGIENNLSIGNMDFDEFADAVGPDGIFLVPPPG